MYLLTREYNGEESYYTLVERYDIKNVLNCVNILMQKVSLNHEGGTKLTLTKDDKVIWTMEYSNDV